MCWCPLCQASCTATSSVSRLHGTERKSSTPGEDLHSSVPLVHLTEDVKSSFLFRKITVWALKELRKEGCPHFRVSETYAGYGVMMASVPWPLCVKIWRGKMILWQNLQQVLDTVVSVLGWQPFCSVWNHCFDHQHLPLRSRMLSVLLGCALVCQPAWDMI